MIRGKNYYTIANGAEKAVIFDITGYKHIKNFAEQLCEFESIDSSF